MPRKALNRLYHMSENPINNDTLLALLLSLIPQDNERLREKALLLATFGNLKQAIGAMEKYLLFAQNSDLDLSKDKELLEKMKNYLN